MKNEKEKTEYNVYTELPNGYIMVDVFLYKSMLNELYTLREQVEKYHTQLEHERTWCKARFEGYKQLQDELAKYKYKQK